MLCNEPVNGAGSGLGQPDQRCVDVIIAAWNCEETIGRAVASALAEAEVRTVIVVDDASTDNTAESARTADDGSGRLTIFRLPKNSGPAAARNKALSLCTAPWIAVLDSDDYFMPGRFSRMLAHAEKGDLIADNLLQISEDHGQVEVLLPATGKDALKPWRCDFETFVLGNISRPGFERKELGFLQPLMRRDFLLKHGIRYDEGLRIGEDYVLCAHALAAGARLLVVPALGYVAVVRRNSLSTTSSKQRFERLRDADLDIAAAGQLTPAERAALRAHRKSVDAIVQWLEVIEAVKGRNASRFMAAYGRSLHVAKYISARLAEQVFLRSFRRIKRLVPGAGLAQSSEIIPAE